MPATITRQSPADLVRSVGIRLFKDALDEGITVPDLLEKMDPSDQYREDTPPCWRTALGRVFDEVGIRTEPNPYKFHSETADKGQVPTWEEATRTDQQRALMALWQAEVWRQAVRTDRRPWPELAAPIAKAYAGGLEGQPETQGRYIHSGARAVLMSGDVAVGGLVNAWADVTQPRALRWQAPVPVSEMIAATREIRGQALRTLYIVDAINTDAYRMKRVPEGSDIPSTWLVSGEHYIFVYKYGRAIKTTYEQLRNETLDRIAFLIARIALQAEVDKAGIAAGVIINGDGNTNTSAGTLTQTGLHSGSSAGTLTLTAFNILKLRFWPYAPTTVLGPENSISQMLNLGLTLDTVASRTDSAYGSVTPINPYFDIGLRYGVTTDVATLKLLMFDRRSAIERVHEIGSDITETERYINNQTQMLAMTESEGYGVVDPNASKLFNINA